MFTIEYVKDLQWSNTEHTVFSCVVKYQEFEEELPTGVDATDPYQHIQEIWARGIVGDYGQIAEYVPTPVIVPNAQDNKNMAVRLLKESDWTATESIADPAVSNPYLTNQSQFLAYRSALREIAVNPQEGFITFPTRPYEVWSS